MSRLLRLLAALAVAALAAGQVAAQGFPSKRIHVIVPYPPGGATDFAGRVLGQYLPAALGQTVVVENRVGGAGVNGALHVSKADPDGHTLLVAPVGLMVIGPYLMTGLPYDVQRDFIPVTNLVSGPAVLVVHPSVPARNVRELVALAKAQPGKLTFGSTGPGQTSHLNGEYLKLLAGIDMLHVPYKGSGPLLPDLLSGQISMNFSTATDGLGMVKAGRLRPIAVTSLRRMAELPDVPTMDESGFPGYDVSNWNGLWVPARTPKAVVDRLQREIAKLFQTPELQARIASLGNVTVGDSPEEFAAYLKLEAAKWSKVIKEASVKLE